MTILDEKFFNVQGWLVRIDKHHYRLMNSRLGYLISEFNLPYTLDWRRNESTDCSILVCPNHSLGWISHLSNCRLNGTLSDIKDVIIEISNKMLGITPVFSKDTIVGVITDGDLRRTLLNNQEISKLKAKDIMSTNPQIIDSETLASEALEIMKKNKISQLIVTNNNSYLGVIHIQSLIKEGIS